MRAQAKLAPKEEEEESAFVSMTDMTVGFLFIMMILLAFFASQITQTETVPRQEHERVLSERNEWRDKAKEREVRIELLEKELKEAEAKLKDLLTIIANLEQERDKLLADNERLELELKAALQEIKELTKLIVQLQKTISEQEDKIKRLEDQLKKLRQFDPLEAYLAEVAQVRAEILTRLRDAIKLDFPKLEVDLSEESDALRFQGEGLFSSGQSALNRDKREIVEKLAQRLDQVLPCFTLGPSSEFDTSCNPGFIMVEAVQIEGHTDDVGSDFVNRNLSAARANSTYFAMSNEVNGLREHLNLKLQPVISVAAYGPDRPVATNTTSIGRSTNRRIDLRFIMVTPRDTSGIDVIRDAFDLQ